MNELLSSRTRILTHLSIRSNRADIEEGMVANVVLDLREKCGIPDAHITYIDIRKKLKLNYDLDLTPQKIGYIVKGAEK